MTEKIDKLVPDTSVLVEGLVSKKIKSKEIEPTTVIIHEAVMAELENQANTGRDIGFLGLEEIESVKNLCEKKKGFVVFKGHRPRAEEIKHARRGEVDALIRDLAQEENATLMTADKVQAKVGKAKNLKVILIEIEQLVSKLKIESYFDSRTMSVHLRENIKAAAKKGIPGKWEFVVIGKKELTRDELREISNEIIEEANVRKDGFIEIERKKSTIVQLGRFRIVITKPPFSDGWEITAVRPVKKMSLEDYKFSEKLMLRISGQAEGILIAGPPGHGKSTMASALAEFYASQNKIVKTIEAPRDLELSDAITQYSMSQGNPHEIQDILLLSRPDYSIFDEMRNTKDFNLFSDLRLAGIGLAGIVHATNPIDAIQRFVGRIELGVIPQVIDTVIFIKDGTINKVLSLKMTVKVPEGMTEADLARPVVAVSDFDTGKMEYELYSYGEETVVIPVGNSGGKSPIRKLATSSITEHFKKFSEKTRVEMVSDHKAIVSIPEKNIPRVIGKEGKNIEAIEEELGISIDIQPLSKRDSVQLEPGKSMEYSAKILRKNVMLEVDPDYANKPANLYVDGDFVMTVKIGKTGTIKISRKNKIGKLIMEALNSDGRVTLTIGR